MPWMHTGPKSIPADFFFFYIILLSYLLAECALVKGIYNPSFSSVLKGPL